MKRNLFLFVIAIFAVSCSKDDLDVEKIPLPEVNQELRDTIETYLSTHYISPENYVISKFNDHDIVLIGEFHRIKHDVELIHHLIPELYNNGIFTLGIEFARRVDQIIIDSLLNAPEYNEIVAQKLIFKFMVFWGYQEYVDIFKVAWQLNHNLPIGSRKFQILGLNDAIDWSKPGWTGYQEDIWANLILNEVIDKGEKALIYSGMHHAFSQYKQPVFDKDKQVFVGYQDSRMGNYLYYKIKKRAFTISLHYPWDPESGYGDPAVYAVDGILDAVMAQNSLDFQSVGFDTKDTPLGKLSGATSIYRHGYSNFTLDMFCDGYIYQKPLSQYQGVTPISNFINEGNIDEARLQSINADFRHASIERFNEAIKADADINRRFAAFW